MFALGNVVSVNQVDILYYDMFHHSYNGCTPEGRLPPTSQPGTIKWSTGRLLYRLCLKKGGLSLNPRACQPKDISTRNADFIWEFMGKPNGNIWGYPLVM